jgi:hypothetical protein
MIGAVYEPKTWPHWEHCRELLSRSAERGGDVRIEAIERELDAKRALLWSTVDGKFCGVTQIVDVNDGKQCFIWQMGGEGDWQACLAIIENYARDEGCKSIEGNMRPGFERVLTDWKRVAVVLRKELA